MVVKRLKLFLVLLIVFLPISTFASNSSDFYVGLGYGQANNNDMCPSNSDCGINESDWVGNIFAGYQLNKNFAVEFGYADLGNYSGRAIIPTILPGETLNVELGGKANAWEMSLLTMLPLTETLNFYARLGQASVNVDMEDTHASFSSGGPVFTVKGKSATNTTTLWGLGAQYRMSDDLNLRAEYRDYGDVGDKHTTGEYGISLYNVAVTYSF